MTLLEAVSTRLEELMQEHNVTQYRLFILSGVSQSTISQIRLRKHKSVNLKIIHEIMDGLGMELIDFFDSPLFKRENLE